MTTAIAINELSPAARHLWFLADLSKRPPKGVVVFTRLVREFGLGEELFWDSFHDLHEAGVIPTAGVTTVIPFVGPPPAVGRQPPHLWAATRRKVFQRDGHVCRYCGTREGPFDCDHVIPVTRGGSNDLANLAVACRPCNQSKRNKLVSEWRRA